MSPSLFPRKGSGEWRAAAAAALGSALAAAALWGAQRLAGVDADALDVVSVATTLAYVWLCRKGGVLSWPIGVLSSLAFSAKTLELGLTGQAWFYLAVFVPMQLWNWRAWGLGAASGGRPAWLGARGRLASLLGFAAATAAIRFAMAAPDGGLWAWWDSSVAAGVALGTVLLGRRNVDGWLVFSVAVNASGAALYATAKDWALCALSLVMLANAVMGMVGWAKEAKAAAPSAAPVAALAGGVP
jgi:nicotinamide riboside transporter PnuC